MRALIDAVMCAAIIGGLIRRRYRQYLLNAWLEAKHMRLGFKKRASAVRAIDTVAELEVA